MSPPLHENNSFNDNDVFDENSAFDGSGTIDTDGTIDGLNNDQATTPKLVPLIEF